MTTSDTRVGGIHHVTAIAGDAQENVDFYAGVLGMRMVKRSVNQDDPGTYHLFYADGGAHPGSDITFFPWPRMGPGRLGTGLTNEIVLAATPDSLDWWRRRLEEKGVAVTKAGDRFGEPTLAFTDPHGLPLAVSASERALERPFTAWEKSDVPEEHQIRGIHAVRLLEQNADSTTDFATKTLGMRHVGHDEDWEKDEGWDRYEGSDPWSGYLEARTAPELPRGAWGVGTVHHVAWRVKDDAQHVALQRAVTEAGLQPTHVIDRFWFKSVYFREPGGVLFELATDGPGFGVDEPMDALGESLVLPPWLEGHRERIEGALPRIRLPHEKKGLASEAPRS